MPHNYATAEGKQETATTNNMTKSYTEHLASSSCLFNYNSIVAK